MGRLSKREKKARLKDTVLSYARGGMKIHEICKRTFLHRNTVRAWIKEGCVEKKKTAENEKPRVLSERELLREVESRLPSEVKAREAEFEAAMKYLTRRRQGFPFLPDDPEF